jgi:demethylmenaquinone methyltransferase/2-methoxy-6-polyprenyl-1,4-benzoquinol methylase
VLDLCCGTGDLAINLARLADDDVELIGVDYSLPMLEIATKKAERLAKGRKISFIYGDAANLSFPDGYFDCVGISFAFRNLTYKNPLAQCHLAEVLKVLSSNGRFIIVETSQPKMKLIRGLFHLYLHWFAYRLGYLLSDNRGAYHYLAESASRFYTAEEIREMLLVAGFQRVFFRPLFFGAVGIHVAVK